MKISVVGHASILIETGGISILSDPWWCGPCFGAQWWNYPPPQLGVLDGKRIDYIYISHGHHDHFHPGTLATLDKTATVLVARSTKLKPEIEALGFKVIEANDSDPIILGGDGVECRIIGTHGDDTLMVVNDGKYVCVNINDALHSAGAKVQSEFIGRLRALYPRINYMFCGYGTASHFPNCYEIPGKNRAETAVHRQTHFNRQWASLVESLKPDYAFPFAADVALLEDDLIWVNEPVHNEIRPTSTHRSMYPLSNVVTIDIAPGFVMENAIITHDVRRTLLNEKYFCTEYAEKIVRANRYGTVNENDVSEVLQLLRDNLPNCEEYLKAYSRNYKFLIKFRNSSLGICMEKTGSTINLFQMNSPDENESKYHIIFHVKLPYLKWSLTRQFGSEIMFVGSGCVFRYRDREDVQYNLHRELITIMLKHNSIMSARNEPKSRLLVQAKKLMKRLLGKEEVDLYDLNTWTKYKQVYRS